MRLFIAFELSAEVKRQLREFENQITLDGAKLRWLKEEQLHVTIKFLGEVGDEQLSDVKNVLQPLAREASPFSVTVLGSGVFPARGPVRIIWAGVDDAEERILPLQQIVERECEKTGFKREERPFRPHITLARVKDDRTRGALRKRVEAAPIEAREQLIDAVTLFQSKLSANGSEYSVVEKVEFNSQ